MKTLQEARQELVRLLPGCTVIIGVEAAHYEFGADSKPTDSTKFMGTIHSPHAYFCSLDTEIIAHCHSAATLNGLVESLSGQARAALQKIADEPVEVAPEPVVGDQPKGDSQP